jgi:hypothetical protein
MAALLGSAWAFLWGVLRRFYWWLPAIILDPLDYNERYIEPALGRNVDLPAFVFPLVFGLGITWAAILAYHEQRVKTLANVVFEIRQACIGFNSYDHNRPEQPLHQADIDLGGALYNKSAERATINAVSVDLLQRRWPLIWCKVGQTSRVTLQNPLGAVVDLYYHGVTVDGRTRSRAVSKIWAYVSVPVNLKDRLAMKYRVRVTVKAVGQQGSATFASLDVGQSFTLGLSEFRRLIESRRLSG